MKNKIIRIFILMVMAIVLLSISVISRAETYSFTFTVNPTEVTADTGETITVNLGIADIDQSTDGINAVQGDLSYDESIFENVEIITTQSNWSVTFNQLNDSDRKGRFVISNLTGSKATQTVAQLKVTIKPDIKASSSTINLNNVFSSYGTIETEKENKVVTVKINKKTNINTGNAIVGNVVNQNTVTGGNSLPQTGVSDWIIIAMLIAMLAAVIGYIKYKKMDI